MEREKDRLRQDETGRDRKRKRERERGWWVPASAHMQPSEDSFVESALSSL